MTQQPVVLALDGITKVYDGAVPVHALRSCSLVIRRGEFVGIVGPSGSGKSTLLNIIGLLDAPSAGSMCIEGQRTTGLRDVELSAIRGRQIGFVFQAFHLLDYRTALQNVALALLYAGVPRRERTQRAQDALHAVGLSQRMTSRPSQMSGGERQRLAIARALVAEPAFVLCDEPTGNLDSVNAGSIVALLAELNAAGRTIIIVTHDDTVARACQRVLRVTDGNVRDDKRPSPAGAE